MRNNILSIVGNCSIFDIELKCHWCGKKYTGGGCTGGFLGTKNYCSRKCKSEAE